MKRMPFSKYRPYPVVDIPDRTWPAKTITKAPRWCSVDLRDGNQALSIPMSVEEKTAFFEFLTACGFKEIEVGFPSASETEFRFVRKLIEENRIPAGVTIQVLTQAREHLIRKTFEAINGAPNAIVHLYNSTSPVQRETVFGKSREEVKAIAVEGTGFCRALKNESTGGYIGFEYSPESFTATELDYALEVCAAVMDVWQPTVEDKMIINLPSTVEMSMPNVFADRIEWFCRHLPRRDTAVISVHAHNDRGTAVATAELAVLAGAERIEGALFGNGERSGNMDIVTMAMNLYSRGIDPELDFSNIDAVRDTYTRCTRMDVHPRHPYAGELVYTAFSGSHQDAINKGMKAYARAQGGFWEVPYIPIDPQDVGRTYEAIIRINSQSGKGGIAYILEKEFGLQVPKWMQPDLGARVQVVTDATGKELTAAEIYACFEKAYLAKGGSCSLEKCHIDVDDEEEGAQKSSAHIKAAVRISGRDIVFESKGNGPVDAFVTGLRENTAVQFTLERFAEHALAHGSDAKAAAYVGIKDGQGKEYFGAGIDANISIASIKAVVNAFASLRHE